MRILLAALLAAAVASSAAGWSRIWTPPEGTEATAWTRLEDGSLLVQLDDRTVWRSANFGVTWDSIDRGGRSWPTVSSGRLIDVSAPCSWWSPTRGWVAAAVPEGFEHAKSAWWHTELAGPLCRGSDDAQGNWKIWSSLDSGRSWSHRLTLPPSDEGVAWRGTCMESGTVWILDPSARLVRGSRDGVAWDTIPLPPARIGIDLLPAGTGLQLVSADSGFSKIFLDWISGTGSNWSPVPANVVGPQTIRYNLSSTLEAALVPSVDGQMPTGAGTFVRRGEGPWLQLVPPEAATGGTLLDGPVGVLLFGTSEGLYLAKDGDVQGVHRPSPARRSRLRILPTRGGWDVSLTARTSGPLVWAVARADGRRLAGGVWSRPDRQPLHLDPVEGPAWLSIPGHGRAALPPRR